MNKLETYFQTDYQAMERELHSIREMIDQSLKTYIHIAKKIVSEGSEEYSWPYVVNSNLEITPSDTYSYSTNSMIISTLLYALGKNKNTYFYIDSDKNFFNTSEIEFERETLSKFIEKLFKELESIRRASKGLPRKKKFEVVSRTYGTNDPMTLLWISNIFDYECKNNISDELKRKYDKFKSVMSCRSEYLKRNNFKIEFTDGYTQNETSFIPLRSLHLIKSIQSKIETKELLKTFEATLHRHLSYSTIPDARFDPAELVFSLEGSLLINGHEALSTETIRSVLSALDKAQQNVASWRPVNPLFASKQGLVFMPLSVEVANSLLRSHNILQSSNQCADLLHEFSRMLSRYCHWLRAHKVEFKDAEATLYGWESEHIGSKGKIDLWQTSEITLFLMSFSIMLERQIRVDSLLASGLSVYSPPQGEITVKAWDEKKNEKEPLIDLASASKYSIYDRIKDDFIQPRIQKEKKPCYSFLLYGPPGTGKTALAKDIADVLQYNLITVTPSDFIAGGESEVESRAKAIFKCLELQKNAVILFDEIDQFLLDRDSEEYKKQTSIFQFMTPGMLPKFNNLRAKENCIFIIATNYAERIDPAIKRTGRLDKHYPLMPPSFSRRKKIIEAQIRKKGTPFESSDISSYSSKIDTFAGRMKLFTYNEICSIIHSVLRSQQTWESVDAFLDKCIKTVNSGDCAIRLKSYGERCLSKISDKKVLKPDEQWPLVEMLLLGALNSQGKMQKLSKKMETYDLWFDEHEFKEQFTAKYKKMSL